MSRRGNPQGLVSLAFSLLCVLSTPAQIQWDTKLVETNVSLDAESVFVEFKYRCLNGASLIATNIYTDCFCSVAGILPGADRATNSYILRIKVDVTTLTGIHVKQVYVATGKAFDVLTIKFSIPYLLTTETEQLEWKVGDPTTQKSTTLKVIHSLPVEILQVIHGNDNLPPILTTLRPGWEYRLTVVPADTKRPDKAVYQVILNYPFGQFVRNKRLTLSAVIWEK